MTSGLPILCHLPFVSVSLSASSRTAAGSGGTDSAPNAPSWLPMFLAPLPTSDNSPMEREKERRGRGGGGGKSFISINLCLIGIIWFQ